LKKKFPTSFDLSPMTKEHFELFCGSYYLLRKDNIVITTAGSIREGKMVVKLPQWTLVQMLGDSVMDGDTENMRRKAKVYTLPYREDPTSETSDNTPAPAPSDEPYTSTVSGEGYQGYLTVFDKTTQESNLRAYGVVGLSSPVTVIKDTVLTDTPNINPTPSSGQKFKVLRRIRAGEKIELLGLPELQPKHMLRAPVRAISDGKQGWITIYDHSWKNGYVEL